jgi:invasion protein IalB
MRAFHAVVLIATIGLSAAASAQQVAVPAEAADETVFPGSRIVVFDPDGVLTRLGMAPLRRAHGRIGEVAYAHGIGPWAVAVVSNERDAAPSDISTRNGWRVACFEDALHDTIACAIERLVVESPSDSIATVEALWFDGTLFCVPGNDYPGKGASIRVDRNPPEEPAADSGCLTEARSARIAAQLAEGEMVRVRLFDWPSESPADYRFPTYGWPEALQMREWMRGLAR